MVIGTYRGVPLEPPTFILMLFLLLFALGTLTAMLFVTSESFKATSGGYGLMIGGPAALWFGGTLLIIGVPFIHDGIFKPVTWPQTIEGLEQNILDLERSAGWISYDVWKRKIVTTINK